MTDKWQPIETAPDNTNVLIWDGHYVGIAAYNPDRDVWEDGIIPPAPRPTHWMPLPEPPSSS